MFRLDLDSEELADAYGRASALLAIAGRKLIQRLHLDAGDHVLDVGCGTGLLAEYVSRIVGPAGLVVGIDPLPLRIAVARKRRPANLRFQVGSALDLSELPAQSFDAGYLHFVFHWLPDRVKPLTELQRVLKPGARLGLTTAALECDNTFESRCAEVLSRPPYATACGAPHARAHRVSCVELEALLRENGFQVSALELEPTIAEWATPEEAIAFSETIAGGNLFGHLPDTLRAAARRELADLLAPPRPGDAVRIEGARIVAVAVRE